MTKTKRGFTLIELMIIVAIIAILAAVAVGRFSNMIAKSKEGHTKGALASMRSTLAIYYADNSTYPTDDLSSLTAGGKYVKFLPTVKLPETGHPDVNTVATGESVATFITDTGGWAYNNNSADNDWGAININCGHTNLKGEVWSKI